ncbi:MAG: hypothetical protein ACREH8_20545 [Opitutaceae bacterium]
MPSETMVHMGHFRRRLTPVSPWQATCNPHQRTTAPRFTGARYVDLGAVEFVGTLQVGFLWSIARHAR